MRRRRRNGGSKSKVMLFPGDRGCLLLQRRRRCACFLLLLDPRTRSRRARASVFGWEGKKSTRPRRRNRNKRGRGEGVSGGLCIRTEINMRWEGLPRRGCGCSPADGEGPVASDEIYYASDAETDFWVLLLLRTSCRRGRAGAAVAGRRTDVPGGLQQSMQLREGRP